MLWEIKKVLEGWGTSEKEHPTPYRMTEKNVENTSGSVVHIIILKPVFAKTVLLILEVQECFAPGAKVQDREKHRVASVKPVNFIGSSGLKESTSVCMPKNLSLKEKPDFSLKNHRKTSE